MANINYYSLEETIAKLGCTEEQLRGLVRSGKLREFRDSGKLTYRKDEVDKLSSETGDNVVLEGEGEMALEDTGEIALAPESGDSSSAKSESDIAAALSGSGTGTDLSAIDLSGSDTGNILSMEGTDELKLEDTGEAAEVKLEDSGSGSDSGEIQLEEAGSDSGGEALTLEDSGSGSGGGDILSLDEVDKDVAEGMKKDDTVITNIGISVFDDDDLEIAADPMAKTLMTGGDEHLGLDGSGAGSGLLDLTRESDDTSLGAELLEGIDMGDTSETIAQTAADAEPSEEIDAEAAMAEPSVEAADIPAPVQMQMVGTVAPVSPAFTGLLIAAAITLALAGGMSVATTMDVWPAYLSLLADNFGIFIGGTILLGGVFALVGWFVGRPPSAPRPAKKAKPKKEKKKKKGKEKKAK